MSSEMKPIVTDTYDFPTLIQRGYVYVDETALLHRLVSGVDGIMFFMSRPRCFGKSLTISTLEQIFKGQRRLFKGLEIEKAEYDWFKYPIIRLDMTAFDQTSGLAHFKKSLAAELGGEDPIAAFRALLDVNYAPGSATVDTLIADVHEVVNEVVNTIDEVVNEVVKSSPGIRKPGILQQIDKSRATVERTLARLIAANRIEFRGAPKTGGYYLKG